MASLSLSGAKGAGRRAHQLHQATASGRPDAAAPGRAVSLSVSVGAATLPRDADSVEGIISVADRRMNRDKAQRKRLGTGALPPSDCSWH